MDMDKNGYLSADEIRIFMSRLGDQMTEQEAEDMVTVLDTNGDGKLTTQKKYY